MGRITVSEMLWIIVKTPGEKFAGVVPTSVAMEPTCSFTVSNRPDRLFMIADTSISLSQSVICSKSSFKIKPPLCAKMAPI